METILSFINQAHAQYGVDPVVFGVLYVASMPPFFISAGGIVQSLRRGRRDRAWFWAVVLLLSYLPAYGYLVLFARNVPWWVYAVAAAAAAVAVFLGGRQVHRLFRGGQP